MKKYLLFVALVLICYSCTNPDNGVQKDAKKDSIAESQKQRKLIDSLMALGDRPDSEQLSPSIQEERKNFIKSYDKIINIDTLFINGNDSLSFSLKYYCLKNHELIIPKKYVFEEEHPKAFITHPFACDIKLVQNGKTIIEKTIDRSTFDAVLWDELKKYAILLEPNAPKFDKRSGDIVLDCSISIPVTDVGVGANFRIHKNGTFTIDKN